MRPGWSILHNSDVDFEKRPMKSHILYLRLDIYRKYLLKVVLIDMDKEYNLYFTTQDPEVAQIMADDFYDMLKRQGVIT